MVGRGVIGLNEHAPNEVDAFDAGAGGVFVDKHPELANEVLAVEERHFGSHALVAGGRIVGVRGCDLRL